MTAKENADYLLAMAVLHGVKDEELANFMGQMQVKSGGFATMEEDLRYSGRHLLETFPGRDGLHDARQADAIAVGGPQAVADAVYGGQWGRENLGNTEAGDGWMYRGRGYVQLTGRADYAEVGRALDLDLINYPELAQTREVAARIALHQWESRVVANHHEQDIWGACRDLHGTEDGLADSIAAVATWQDRLNRGYVPGQPYPDEQERSRETSLPSDAAGQRAEHEAVPVQPLRLDDPRHPGHVMYLQALAAVDKLDQECGHEPDPRRGNLAASLVVAAQRDGLTRIDGIVLSNDASKIFAVEGERDAPLQKLAEAPTAQAIATPIEQSSAVWAQQARQHEEQQQQAQMQEASKKERGGR